LRHRISALSVPWRLRSGIAAGRTIAGAILGGNVPLNVENG